VLEQRPRRARGADHPSCRVSLRRPERLSPRRERSPPADVTSVAPLCDPPAGYPLPTSTRARPQNEPATSSGLDADEHAAVVGGVLTRRHLLGDARRQAVELLEHDVEAHLVDLVEQALAEDPKRARTDRIAPARQPRSAMRRHRSLSGPNTVSSIRIAERTAGSRCGFSGT
jgi:hypothetical protein